MILGRMAHKTSSKSSSGGVLRVGIVGANPSRGWGSGVHRPVVQMLPGFELSAVCTTKIESAREAAALFGARHAFTSADELANCPDVDVVSVCVLAPQHRVIAEAAIKAGKHVYCEWPLALTIEDAEALTALAEVKGVKALIGLHLRGAPALRYAAELIGQGFIGKLAGVSLVASLPGIITGSMATRAGGTTLTTIYCGHLLDAMDFYFGGIAELDARSSINLPQADEKGRAMVRDAADHLVIQGALNAGALFSMDVTGAALAGFGSSWRITGTEGVIELSTADPSLPAMEGLRISGAKAWQPLMPMEIPAAYECAEIPENPDRYPVYPGMDAPRSSLVANAAMYNRLRDAIFNNGAVTPDFTRAVYVQKLVAQADAAAQARRC